MSEKNEMVNSLPENFVDRMKFMLGRECDAFLACFVHKEDKENENESFFGDGEVKALRLNPLKDDFLDDDIKNNFIEKFPGELEKIEWEKLGYTYDKANTPGKLSFHMAGVYYIQEPSAMVPVSYLDVHPGQNVLDLCAAPGGKSSQIAGRMTKDMKMTGLLVSNEISPQRAKILSENIERLGIANALVLNETPKKLSSRFEGFFDRIAVDAPCSGEGMFRKNDLAIDNWSAENVRMCADRQDEILDEADKMLAIGGRIVYSTCTFAPDEDEGTIYRFLKRHPEYEVVNVSKYDGMESGVPSFALLNSADKSTWKENIDIDLEYQIKNTIRIWPHKSKGEGHFVAVLQRKGDMLSTSASGLKVPTQKGIDVQNAKVSANNLSSNKNKLKSKDKKRDFKSKGKNNTQNDSFIKIWEEFADDTLSDEGKSKINGKLFLFGDNLYLAPENMPDTNGFKVARAGLHLGTVKKDRFEPSHALALFLKKEDVKRYVSFDYNSDEIKNFTAGLSINIKSEKGWTLILTDGYSIGFAKSDGNKLKNHYPKGLRVNY